MTSTRVHRRVAPIAIVLALIAAGWSSPALGAAVVTTAFGSNQVLIYPEPNAGLPNPPAIPVANLPPDARPQGLSCLPGTDTCLVADSGNFRVFVIQVSTASVVATIATTSVYSGAGTLAVNPQQTFALAIDPFVFTGVVTVIAAPFQAGSTVSTVPVGGVLTGGTQSIVFAPSGRAFVCTGTAIVAIDPPYTAAAFSMALPPQSGCSQLAFGTTAQGEVLLAPSGKQVAIFTGPFSGATAAAVLPLPDADLLGGASVTPDGAQALVVDQDGESIWAISAPFTPASPVERIPMPALLPGLQQIAVSPDNQLAIATGGGGNENPRLAFMRPPFTAAGATVFPVFVDGGTGFGAAAFTGPAGPPGPPPPPPPCIPITLASASMAVLPRQLPGEGTVPLAAAVLPTSRSVRVGCPATAFVTIINAGSETATEVGIAPSTNLPVDFVYQTTDPATNALTGTPNTPVDIPAGQFQTYVVALTPRAPFPPTEVEFNYFGTNTALVQPLVGINTLLLSASDTDVPDIVALAATPNNNGIVDVPTTTNLGAFAVATVNVGLGAPITVSADTGAASLPLSVLVCQTDAQGGCLANPAPSVTALIGTSGTPTFAFFVFGQGPIPFDPAVNRIFARFKDEGGITRGSTSVAVRTTP